MNISELIAQLEELRKEHGDLPVYYCGSQGRDEVGTTNLLYNEIDYPESLTTYWFDIEQKVVGVELASFDL